MREEVVWKSAVEFLCLVARHLRLGRDFTALVILTCCCSQGLLGEKPPAGLVTLWDCCSLTDRGSKEHRAIHTKRCLPGDQKWNLLYSKVRNVSGVWMLPEAGQPFLTWTHVEKTKHQTLGMMGHLLINTDRKSSVKCNTCLADLLQELLEFSTERKEKCK